MSTSTIASCTAHTLAFKSGPAPAMIHDRPAEQLSSSMIINNFNSRSISAIGLNESESDSDSTLHVTVHDPWVIKPAWNQAYALRPAARLSSTSDDPPARGRRCPSAQL